MSIRVLVVDDSTFICKRIRDILQADSEFSVVGVAHNGLEAVSMVASHKPDVVTMDVEMPIMDGITAVKQIMSSHPCPILMLSAMTQAGAQATFDALAAGAVDFMPKQLDQIDSHRQTAETMLRRRVRMVAGQAGRLPKAQPVASVVSAHAAVAVSSAVRNDATSTSGGAERKPDLLVVAASTGGPVALQQALAQIPAHCGYPILLLQHMPKQFTKSFAERLNQQCHIRVEEAKHGDFLEPGLALLAPGGVQMLIQAAAAGKWQVVLREKWPQEIYSPCVDTSFASIADVFKGKVLAVVLTGMGCDGQQGAAQLKRHGARIWAQDEASCIVYGMPRAVVEAHLADKVYSLADMASALARLN
jgi:two-component system, chemotaxis family, protein-glutamate methylesterase/glutaminase